MKNYYKILGVDINCSATDVKKVYRKLSKKYHPDVNNGNKIFEERFKNINEAYAVLSNAEKRKIYDFQFYRYNATKNSASSYTAHTPYHSNKEPGKSTGYSKTTQNASANEENVSGNGEDWSQAIAMLRIVWICFTLYITFMPNERSYNEDALSSFYKDASSHLSGQDTPEPQTQASEAKLNETKYIYVILKTDKPALVHQEGSSINDSMSATSAKSMDIDSVKWVHKNYGSSVGVIENFDEHKKNKIKDQLVKDLLDEVAFADQNFHEDVSAKVTDEHKKKEFFYYDSNVVGIKYYVFDTYKEASKFRSKNKKKGA